MSSVAEVLQAVGRTNAGPPPPPPFDKWGGWQEVVPVAAPAAGAGFTRKVPAEAYELILALTFRLVCSATVVNRFVVVTYETEAANVLGVSTAGATFTASTTSPLTFSTDAGVANVGNGIGGLAALPKILLEPARVVRVAVQGIDATDQLDRIFFVVARYPTDVVNALAEAGLLGL